jgi:hypothetical protein
MQADDPTPQTFVDVVAATDGIVRISACQDASPLMSDGGVTTAGPQPASANAAEAARSDRGQKRIV